MANFYGNDADNLSNGDVGGAFVNYYGGDGNDQLAGSGTGGTLDNAIYGGQGNDILSGSQLTGSTGNGTTVPYANYQFLTPSGNDYLDGGAGRDGIFGADGNDTIYG